MWNKLLDFLCPARVQLDLMQSNTKRLIDAINEYSIKVSNLEGALTDKLTMFSKESNKLSVTSHAVHRYKERYKIKASDEDVSKELTKLLIQQLYTMDTLPDGKYTLKKGVVGVVKNNTLVTIIPKRDYGKPKLK